MGGLFLPFQVSLSLSKWVLSSPCRTVMSPFGAFSSSPSKDSKKAWYSVQSLRWKHCRWPAPNQSGGVGMRPTHSLGWTSTHDTWVSYKQTPNNPLPLSMSHSIDEVVKTQITQLQHLVVHFGGAPTELLFPDCFGKAPGNRPVYQEFPCMPDFKVGPRSIRSMFSIRDVFMSK